MIDFSLLICMESIFLRGMIFEVFWVIFHVCVVSKVFIW